MIINESINGTLTKPRLILVPRHGNEERLLETLGPVQTAITGVLCKCTLTNKIYVLLEAAEIEQVIHKARQELTG